MHLFRTLGGIGLSGTDGNELDALLRQPKRVALLSYLAMPRPGTWHRRDSLLATFWPENDQARARTALRSALYTLRRHLEDGAIRTRGDEEVSLDPDIIATDVGAMLDDLAAGRNAEALERYSGDFLPGLHVDDAEGFEKWLGQERSRLNALARKAAHLLADSREGSGDFAGAVEAARRASELDPDDEAAARRWIAALDRSGDRAQAFAVYEKFRKHMSEEFGTRPSAETVALVDSVRTRRTANELSVTRPPSAPSPLPEAQETAAPSGAGRSTSASRWAIAAIALVAIAVVWVGMRGRREGGATSVGRSLVVLPAENETGDPKLDYIGSGIAEGVARRLEGIGGLKIRSGARSDWPAATLHDYKTIGREFGATVLLRSTLSRVGDSLEVRASVVDAETSGERSIGARRFVTSQLVDVESVLAAQVAGAVFRVPLPTVPRQPARQVDPESYRLTMEGWHRLLELRGDTSAEQLFQRATEIDALNARAWAGLSSAWGIATITGIVPFDVGYDRMSAAAARALALDSLQSSAWANLGILRALKYRSVAVGAELIQKATAAEPGNAEIFLIKSTLYRHAHQWDKARDAIRVARAMDPLSSIYAEREAFLELCADRPDVALKLYQTQVMVNPADKLSQAGLIRSLVRLGRYDDAIAAWRKQVDPKDRRLVEALATARGADGYWAAKHIEGQPGLVAIEKEEKAGWVSPTRSILAHFLGGDIEGGYARIAMARRLGEPRLYHLPCLPGVEEVRQTPRFQNILKEIGPLPDR